MGFLGAIGHAIMTPLYYAISVILVGFHKALAALGLPEAGGANWALSVIGLTLVVRILLIPLFVKQIKSSRNLALIQPKVRELQKKYGHDRELLTQKTMELYKDAGTNPFASCLPLLIQMPIFLALFRLLDQAAKKGKAHGVLTEDMAEQFGQAKLWGQVPISGTFMNADGNTLLIAVAIVLVLAMTATTFMTQRQLMAKNMPADALSGPFAQQQKMLLYVLPVVFGVGGIAFPIALLIYWTTSNLWTMGQQFYVIRNNPAPNTPAFDAKKQRDEAKALKRGRPLPVTEEPQADEATVDEGPVVPVRQQPKRQTKAQRQKKKK